MNFHKAKASAEEVLIFSGGDGITQKSLKEGGGPQQGFYSA
jgi:hypothetical protein